MKDKKKKKGKMEGEKIVIRYFNRPGRVGEIRLYFMWQKLSIIFIRKQDTGT